jgi:hypothetical protein
MSEIKSVGLQSWLEQGNERIIQKTLDRFF